jgi:hypothetical protein
MSTVTVLRPRITPIPQTEPPYDEGFPVERPESGTAIQGTLALTFTLPSGVPANPAAWLRLVPTAPPEVPPTPPPAPRTRPARATSAAADPQDWSLTLARAVVEVLAGDRPVSQLVHWTAPRVYGQLSRLAAASGARSTAERTSQRRGVVRRVHVCRPVYGVAEVNTVIHGGTRARALAFRLELISGRWTCTALQLG